jgi:hypothetical protein
MLCSFSRQMERSCRNRPGLSDSRSASTPLEAAQTANSSPDRKQAAARLAQDLDDHGREGIADVLGCQPKQELQDYPGGVVAAGQAAQRKQKNKEGKESQQRVERYVAG